MKKLIFIILSIAFISSCTDIEGTNDALLDAGYHPIKVGGYDFFNGSKGDFYKTRFDAYSPDSSRIIHGCVYKGLFFKGKTIRLD